MDADRFDRLTEALARIPRRTMLQGMVSGVLAMGTGMAKTPSAAACVREGRACGNGRGRCCGSLACCGRRCRRRNGASCGKRTTNDPFAARTCCSGSCEEVSLGFSDTCVTCLPPGAACENRGDCCPGAFCDGVTESCQSD
jgi:hypothetical protein